MWTAKWMITKEKVKIQMKSRASRSIRATSNPQSGRCSRLAHPPPKSKLLMKTGSRNSNDLLFSKTMGMTIQVTKASQPPYTP